MATDINWPSGLPTGEALPCALREGYGYQQRSPNLRTQRGLVSRSRRIYSDAPTDLTAGWIMSAEERFFFDGFFWHTLDAGNAWLNMPLLINGAVEMVEVSFDGVMPRFDLVGVNHWRVTASLQTRKGTQMDANLWGLVNDAGGVGPWTDLLQALSDFANNGDY